MFSQLFRRGSQALFLACCLPVACVDGQEPTLESYCRTLCGHADDCYQGTVTPFTPATLRQCQRECMTDPTHGEHRDEALLLAADCYAARDCGDDTGPVVVDGVPGTEYRLGDAVSACFDEAGADIDSTPECEEFCEVLTEHECGSALSSDACLASSCVFEPSALIELDHCFELDDCAATWACLPMLD